MASTTASGVSATMDRFSAELGRNFSSLFCRGFGTDAGACVSLILGVLTTQTYAQAVIGAKTDRDARIGAVVSTVLIPIIGVFGIVVGLYMRTVTDPATFAAKTALTSFILNYSNMPEDKIIKGMTILGEVIKANIKK